MLSGGAIYREQNIILSPFDNDVTRNFYARRMFMGAQGLGPLGLMESDPLLIQAEQKLIDQADELVVLVDSSKFRQRSSLILCGAGAHRHRHHRRRHRGSRGQDAGECGRDADHCPRGQSQSGGRLAAGLNGPLLCSPLMATIRTVAVIDIGKTNAKVALVDLAALPRSPCAARRTRCCATGPIRTTTSSGCGSFILDSLAELNREPNRSTRSASPRMARPRRCVDADGELALPVLDYEHDGPDALAADYDAVRPPFAETGTPRLPVGLNLGAQLFWQARTFPDDFARGGRDPDVPAILGVPPDRRARQRSDLARLPHRSVELRRRQISRRWSTGMGWRRLMAPLAPRRRSCSGPILPDVAAATGLDPARRSSAASTIPTPRCCRICCPPATAVRRRFDRHLGRSRWRSAATPVELDPARDTLVNVNAFGEPVPSARFMGGREFEIWSARGTTRGLRGRDRGRAGATDPAAAVGAAGLGPFPRRGGRLDRRRAAGGRRARRGARSIWR